MPIVMDPQGNPVSVPYVTNGGDLKKVMNLPPNKNLYKVSPDGAYQRVPESGKVSLREGDRIDAISSFRRGR